VMEPTMEASPSMQMVEQEHYCIQLIMVQLIKQEIHLVACHPVVTILLCKMPMAVQQLPQQISQNLQQL
ncbi:MAG TPA: hypothetical protein PLZ63_06715, partial [Bacteroidia bacterium]|nr:hypothetical protein [Bacteroidia bacterium]